MFYPEELIEEVRQQNDIVDVLSSYVRLEGRGNTYKGLCPFHNEKTASFNVFRDTQMYYCFGCHAAGSVYTFLMKYENYTFPEAVHVLADRAGMRLPEREETKEEKEKRNRRERLLRLNRAAGIFYFKQLRGERGELGRRYFEERGLKDEIMQRFGLGYSLQYNDGLLRFLKREGYTDEEILSSGLANYNEKQGMRDYFFNRVMFPIMDMNNKIIGFGGRVMGSGEPKYLNSPETELFRKRKNLYGLNYARTSRAGNFILCEGYMDVISMHQAGFTQAMASLGTAFTPEQAGLLKRYNKNILLAYDSDGAGKNAALKALHILRQHNMKGRVINMQPYKDPDEFIKALGAEEFQKRIDAAENGFMFEVRMVRGKYDTSDPEGKSDFEKEIAVMLCRFSEELERENYIRAVAEQYRISPEGLRKAVISAASSGRVRALEKMEEEEAGESAPKRRQKKEPAGITSQKALITWLIDRPEYYPEMKKWITAEDFTDPINRRIAERLMKELEKGRPNPAGIIDSFEEEEEQQQAAAVFHTRLEAIETEQEKKKAFYDILVNVKKYADDLRFANPGSDMGEYKKLLEAKKNLEKLQAVARNL